MAGFEPSTTLRIFSLTSTSLLVEDPTKLLQDFPANFTLIVFEESAETMLAA